MDYGFQVKVKNQHSFFFSLFPVLVILDYMHFDWCTYKINKATQPILNLPEVKNHS